MSEPMKVCKKCGAELPLDAFYREHRNTDGHRGSCKSCMNQGSKAWKAANPEKAREYDRRWKKAHPDMVRAQERRTRERHPETRRAVVRRSRDAHRANIAAYKRAWRQRRKEQQSEPSDPY